MSLLQPNNSLILPKNHYLTNFYYHVPQDHYYSHKLTTFLFHLIATVSFKISQKQRPASPLLQSYLFRQQSRYHLYLYEELPGCSAAKTFKLRAFLVRRRCLPNSQRTQALKSITIRKHIHWSRGFPYGKKS